MNTWWKCPAGACDHAALLHDGDGVDEDYICTVFGCTCRSAVDEHGRISPVRAAGPVDR
jgi:hypothetical protein